MFKRSILRGFVLALTTGFLGSPLIFAQSSPKIGTLTITTYYPSPFGVYNELRAKRMAIGDTYYDPSTTSINDPADLIVEGDVGVGTTNPGSKLGVNGGISAGTYSGTAAPSNGMIVSGNVGIGTTSPGSKLDVTGTAQLRGAKGKTGLYVNSGGNVGIGTTSPGSKLDVNGGIKFKSPGSLWSPDTTNYQCPQGYYVCGFNCTGDCSTDHMRIKCCKFY